MPSTARGPFLNSRTRPWVSMAASDTPPTLRRGRSKPALSGARGLARQVRQVLHSAHAVHAARSLRELLHDVLARHLPAEVDDSILGVDGDAPLRKRVVAEDLALDLAGEGRVIEPLLSGLTPTWRCTLHLAGVTIGVRLRGVLVLG